MDNEQFDRLARAVAAGVSRRTALRGLVGAAAGALLARARADRAAAQTSALPLGAACTSAAQCSQAGGPVACADNGYADDGALNCCRNEGGACLDETYSADCCSGLYCRGGVCTDLSATGELPLGSYCTATSQCSQAGGAVVCADNGIATDGALNCCRTAGGACSSEAGCCGGLSCVGGVCTGGGTAGGTLPLGAECVTTAECAPSSGGSVVCASNNIASDGALNCCLEQGGACGSNSSVCCGDLFCVGGVCGAPVFGDLALGAVCTATIECSQASGPAICADNGNADDGGLNCCLLEASACSADAECCAGLVCGDNMIAGDGARNCCGFEGSPCQSDAACCDALFCVEGACQPI